MGVLETVLNYKAQREAQANADLQAIPQSIMVFQQARQAAKKAELEEMLTHAQINKIKIETEQLGKKSLIDDIKTANEGLSFAKETNNEALFNQFRDSTNTRLGIQSPAPQQTSELPSVDDFIGGGIQSKPNVQPLNAKSVNPLFGSVSEEKKNLYTYGPTGHKIDTGTLSKDEQYKLLPDDKLSAIASQKNFKGDLTEDAAFAKIILDKRKTVTDAEGRAVGPNFVYDKNIRLIKDIISKPDFDWGPFGAARINKKGSLGSTITNPEQKKIRTLLSSLKTQAFDIGGSALSPTEEALILDNANPTGKTPEEFMQGLDLINEKIQVKAVNQGGMDARKFDYTSTEKDIKSERPTDTMSKEGIGNQLKRKYLLGNKALTDFITFGNSNAIAEGAGRAGLVSQESVDEYNTLQPQSPIEHMIAGAPNIYAAKQLAGLGINALRAGLRKRVFEATANKLEPTVANASAKATAEISRLKPEEGLNKIIPAVRENIKKNYVLKNYSIYEKKLDLIKGSPNPVKTAQSVVEDLALKRNEGTGNFLTTEIKKVYDGLSKKVASGKTVTESDLVDAIKTLKSAHKGHANSARHANYEAANELSSHLTGKNAEILKSANAGYREFKVNYKNIDELIGLDESKIVGDKFKDEVVRRLLRTDLGQNQQRALHLTGDVSGMKDFADIVSKYRGLIQTAEASKKSLLSPFIHAGEGLKKMLLGAPESGSSVSNKVQSTLQSVHKQNKSFVNTQNKNTVKILQDLENAAAKKKIIKATPKAKKSNPNKNTLKIIENSRKK